MHRSRQKYIALAIALATLSLWSLSLMTKVGTATSQLAELTPKAQVYLPFVAKQATPTATPIPSDDIANEQSIADQLNQQRSLHGLPFLPLVSELTQAARRHSRDMADHNFTSHTGSDGSNAGQRMRDAGYSWTTWGEIIGWGFGGNTASMVNWWMNSPPHKSIILSGSFVDFGVGYARNPNSSWGHYWTVNFGRRAIVGAEVVREPYLCEFALKGPIGGSSLLVYSFEPCE